MSNGQGWVLSDPVNAARGAAAGAFGLSGDEIGAWDAFAAAMISNLTDRTMGADVAAGLAATIADAMIMERRKRPRAVPVTPAPRLAPAPIDPVGGSHTHAIAPASEVRAATGSPVMPSAADAVATPAASAASDATEAVCECGHGTGYHVREALGVDRWLRCAAPGCGCARFTRPAAATPPGGAGL